MINSLFIQKGRRVVWFALGGAINTAFTYGLYLLLSTLLNYQVAFCIAYFMGVIGAYWFNSTVIFRVPLSWKGFFTYPLIYVIQYIFSALFLQVLVETVGVPRIWAPLAVTAGMLPVTFLMNKFVLEWIRPRVTLISDRF